MRRRRIRKRRRKRRRRRRKRIIKRRRRQSRSRRSRFVSSGSAGAQHNQRRERGTEEPAEVPPPGIHRDLSRNRVSSAHQRQGLGKRDTAGILPGNGHPCAPPWRGTRGAAPQAGSPSPHPSAPVWDVRLPHWSRDAGTSWMRNVGPRPRWYHTRDGATFFLLQCGGSLPCGTSHTPLVSSHGGQGKWRRAWGSCRRSQQPTWSPHGSYQGLGKGISE